MFPPEQIHSLGDRRIGLFAVELDKVLQGPMHAVLFQDTKAQDVPFNAQVHVMQQALQLPDVHSFTTLVNDAKDKPLVDQTQMCIIPDGKVHLMHRGDIEAAQQIGPVTVTAHATEADLPPHLVDKITRRHKITGRAKKEGALAPALAEKHVGVLYPACSAEVPIRVTAVDITKDLVTSEKPLTGVVQTSVAVLIGSRLIRDTQTRVTTLSVQPASYVAWNREDGSLTRVIARNEQVGSSAAIHFAVIQNKLQNTILTAFESSGRR